MTKTNANANANAELLPALAALGAYPNISPAALASCELDDGQILIDGVAFDAPAVARVTCYRGALRVVETDGERSYVAHGRHIERDSYGMDPNGAIGRDFWRVNRENFERLGDAIARCAELAANDDANASGFVGDEVDGDEVCIDDDSIDAAKLPSKLATALNAGDYANAYKTQDLARALAAFGNEGVQRTEGEIHAFTAGFFATYEAHEVPAADRDDYENAIAFLNDAANDADADADDRLPLHQRIARALSDNAQVTIESTHLDGIHDAKGRRVGGYARIRRPHEWETSRTGFALQINATRNGEVFGAIPPTTWFDDVEAAAVAADKRLAAQGKRYRRKFAK